MLMRSASSNSLTCPSEMVPARVRSYRAKPLLASVNNNAARRRCEARRARAVAVDAPDPAASGEMLVEYEGLHEGRRVT